MVSPYRTFFLTGFVLLAAPTLALRFAAGWPWIWAYVIGVNAATILLYGHDKLAARRRWLRVPENVLHAFAFLGGSPGAIAAQQLFRHKTQKRSFRTVFWLVAALQIALILLVVFWPQIRERL